MSFSARVFARIVDPSRPPRVTQGSCRSLSWAIAVAMCATCGNTNSRERTNAASLVPNSSARRVATRSGCGWAYEPSTAANGDRETYAIAMLILVSLVVERGDPCKSAARRRFLVQGDLLFVERAVGMELFMELSGTQLGFEWGCYARRRSIPRPTRSNLPFGFLAST